MVYRTFIDKSNTIIMDSEDNYGLNPICMLNYGAIVSRFLVHFDESKIKELAEEKYISDKDNAKHILKMKNCASVDMVHMHDRVPADDKNGIKDRATSFDLLFFKVPQKWYSGCGFDSSNDFFTIGKGKVSQNNCNWYNAYDGYSWNTEGMYSNSFMADEYVKFSRGEDSVIIGRQHFEHGNEDIEIDITDYVNSVVYGKEVNYGIGVMFTPMMEEAESKITQYVGFFNNNTNTFYEPYVETRILSNVNDSRYNFVLGKKNRLYFFPVVDGQIVNLDEMPTCDIEGSQMEVKQQTKGCYYVELKLSSKEYDSDMILYDVWSNIKYNGDELDDVEMSFVTKRMSVMQDSNDYFPSVLLRGINDFEKVTQDHVRMVTVDYKIPYSSKAAHLDSCKYRIYVVDEKREYDVVSWDNVENLGEHGYFYIDMSTLLPHTYHIDIMVSKNGETRTFHDELKFKVTNNIGESKW